MVFPKRGLEFPSLTICTLQKYNKTKLETMYPEMSQIVAEFGSMSFFSAHGTALMDLSYFAHNNYSIEDLQNELDASLGETSFLNFIEGVSFECRGQFLLCWFENGYIFDCCNESMPLKVKRFFIHNGPCFEFFTKPLKQRLPGPVGGFGFAYWFPMDHVMPTAFNAYDEHGLHAYTSPTEAMLEKNPVVIPVGSHVRISLQATKTSRLTVDQLGRSTCVEQKLHFFDNYTYPACQVECLVNALLHECNCIGVNTFGNLPKEKICSAAAAYKCYVDLAFRFSSMLAKCRLNNCSEPCAYWSYKVFLSSGKVFNRINEKAMVEHWRLPPGDPKVSLIIGDVYFSDIEYMDMQQIPSMTLENFVSNIGGAMGLWTGASIVTWVHLIYFCIHLLCRREKKQQLKEQEAMKSMQIPNAGNVDPSNNAPILSAVDTHDEDGANMGRSNLVLAKSHRSKSASCGTSRRAVRV